MGADIHLFAERKLSDGTWAMCKTYEAQHVEQYRNDTEAFTKFYLLFHRARSRNYHFFADLAGVRGQGPDPKGIPDDASPLVLDELKRWDLDAHSCSWYSAREFIPIFMENHMSEDERAKLVSDRLDESSYGILETVLSRYLGIDAPYDNNDNCDLDAIRFVFWFDN